MLVDEERNEAEGVAFNHKRLAVPLPSHERFAERAGGDDVVGQTSDAWVRARSLVAGFLMGGVHTVVIAIALTRVPLSTRVIRSVVFSVKELAYIDAARALGARPRRIMPHHVAPQCVAPLLVIVSLNLGSAIFAEAALSFLGVGVPPPAPSWGNMLGGVLAEAFRPPWWLVVFPGLAITATIMATNLLGDALRDFLDPRLKGGLGEQLT